MGVIKLSFQLVVYTAVVVAVIILVPGIPPDIDFKAHTVTPARKLEGKLAPNTILDKAELVFDGDYRQPESIALRGDEAFTGVNGGHVIRIKDGKITKVVKLGKDCAGDWEEHICGRPLGMRFDNQGKLLVADAYYGIFKVDVDKGVAENIFPSTQKVNGRVALFPDDLDVDKDGIIYWSDASAIATFENQCLEILGEPSGRLIKFNPKTKESVVLIDGLHFANGVQLSRKEDFVVVAETGRSRVWKYHLKGDKKGQKEILIDDLPGYPDNVRSNGRGGFYISLVIARQHDSPSMVEKLLPIPMARKLILRSQFLALSLLSTIDSFIPNVYIKQAEYYLKHLGPLLDGTCHPKKVIIVDVDENGTILGTLQNKDGKISFISETSIGAKYTYFGSPITSQLWRIKTEYLNG